MTNNSPYSGRVRIREARRLFRAPLFVLQVEVGWRIPPRPGAPPGEQRSFLSRSLFWRDATLMDCLQHPTLASLFSASSEVTEEK